MKHYTVSITFETEAAGEEACRIVTKEMLAHAGIPSDYEIEVEEVE